MALHAQLHKEVEVEEVDKISLNLSNHSFSSHSHSGMLRTLSKLSNAPAPFMIMTQLPVQATPFGTNLNRNSSSSSNGSVEDGRVEGEPAGTSSASRKFNIIPFGMSYTSFNLMEPTRLNSSAQYPSSQANYQFPPRNSNSRSRPTDTELECYEILNSNSNNELRNAMNNSNCNENPAATTTTTSNSQSNPPQFPEQRDKVIRI
jgi:hypothetical protein